VGGISNLGAGGEFPVDHDPQASNRVAFILWSELQAIESELRFISWLLVVGILLLVWFHWRGTE
jgi:hypothetical protein